MGYADARASAFDVVQALVTDAVCPVGSTVIGTFAHPHDPDAIVSRMRDASGIEFEASWHYDELLGLDHVGTHRLIMRRVRKAYEKRYE